MLHSAVDKRAQQPTSDASLGLLETTSIFELLPVSVLVANIYSQTIVTAKILQNLRYLDQKIPADASEAAKLRKYREFAEQLYSATEDVSDYDKDVFWKQFTQTCFPGITKLPVSLENYNPMPRPNPRQARVLENRLWKRFFLVLIDMPFRLSVTNGYLNGGRETPSQGIRGLSCREILDRPYNYRFVDVGNIETMQVELNLGMPGFEATLTVPLRAGSITVSFESNSVFSGDSPDNMSPETELLGNLTVANDDFQPILEILATAGAMQTQGMEWEFVMGEFGLTFFPRRIDDTFVGRMSNRNTDFFVIQKFKIARLLALPLGDVEITARGGEMGATSFVVSQNTKISEILARFGPDNSLCKSYRFLDADTGIVYGIVYGNANENVRLSLVDAAFPQRILVIVE